MTDLASQRVQGLRLDQYAGICAAIATGFSLPEALENEGLDTPSWRRAGPAWAAKLAGKGPDAPLRRTYAQKLAEADAWLGRQIKPMDEDLESWLGFLGAWAVDPCPVEFLARLELSALDVTRLQRGWTQRLAIDQSLRKRVLALAARRPHRLPNIRIVPARLRPFPWSSPRTRHIGNVCPRVAELTPEHGGALAPAAVAIPSFLLDRAPPVAGTVARGVDRSTLAFTVPGRPALPFAAAAAPELTMEQHASLHVELALFPARAAEIMRRYGVSEQARIRLDQHYANVCAASPSAHAAWQRACRAYREWLLSQLHD